MVLIEKYRYFRTESIEMNVACIFISRKRLLAFHHFDRKHKKDIVTFRSLVQVISLKEMKD